MFWIENMIIVGLFTAYLCILTPFIYIRMLYNLFRSTKWFNFMWISLMWIFFGAFLLPFYIAKDILYFFKICCDYGEVANSDSRKIIDAAKEDKLIIYNELLDVMKVIYE